MTMAMGSLGMTLLGRWSWPSTGVSGVDEEGQDFTDGALPPDGLRER